MKRKLGSSVLALLLFGILVTSYGASVSAKQNTTTKKTITQKTNNTQKKNTQKKSTPKKKTKKDKQKKLPEMTEVRAGDRHLQGISCE